MTRTTVACAQQVYQRSGIEQEWFTTLMQLFQTHAAGNRRFFRPSLATARPVSRRTQALDPNIRITNVEDLFSHPLVHGGQIVLHRDPFRKQKYSQERHNEIVAKYSGIIDPSTTERAPEPLPYPYIGKTNAHRSLRDSLNSKGAAFQFPGLMAGTYPVLDLKQWGDIDAVIGAEEDDNGYENDTVVNERRPVIWRELVSTYTVPSCAPLQWCPFTPVRKVPKGTLQKLKVTRSWHNEILTKEQQVTLLARLQDKMLEEIKKRLKTEKRLKADRYWIHYRILAKATEGIWEVIVRKGTQWVGGRRLVPFHVETVDVPERYAAEGLRVFNLLQRRQKPVIGLIRDRQHILVAERTSLGHSRGPACVLEHSDIFGTYVYLGLSFGGHGEQRVVIHCAGSCQEPLYISRPEDDDALHGRASALHNLDRFLGNASPCDYRFRATVFELVRDLPNRGLRIDRDDDRAGLVTRFQPDDVLRNIRRHQCNTVAFLYSQSQQTVRESPCHLIALAIGQGSIAVDQVRSFGMRFRILVEFVLEWNLGIIDGMRYILVVPLVPDPVHQPPPLRWYGSH